MAEPINERLAANDREIARLKHQEREIRNFVSDFTASDKLSREDLHNRSH